MVLISDEYYHDPGAVLKEVKQSDPDLIISSRCTEIFGDSETTAAFYYSRDTLQSFSFEQNPQLTKIGSYSFYKCTKLTSIDLSSCTKLITIGEKAFCLCSSVQNLLLPEGLKTIFKYAFSGLKLTSVEIPSTVSSMYDHAIADSQTLTSITFREGSQLLFLGNNIFIGTKLTQITIPQNVNSINGAFCNGVKTLEIVKVHQNNNYFIGDNRAVYNKDYTTIYFYAAGSGTSYTIPNTIKAISYAAFISAEFSSIIIPDSVTSIGAFAFADTKKLTQITLPKSIKTILSACFAESSLTSITIPDNVITINENAFRNCNSLTSIELPENISSIGGGAFPISNNLQITFKGESLMYIDDQMLLMTKNNSYISMFLNSTSTSVTIPSTVKTIKSSSFKDKKNLVKVLCDGTSQLEIIENYAFQNCNSLTTIPDFPNLKSVGMYAFSNTKLSSAISFPESLTLLDEYSFASVKTLPSVSFKSKVENLTIKDCSFYACSSLTSVLFIDCRSDIYIGSKVFFECTSLSAFNIISNIKTVGNSCFMNSGLNTINFENSETSFNTLPSMFLKGCTNIEEIIIPTNIEIIGNECFSETSISYISIPDSVTTLSTQCFSGCSQLDHVDISSTSGLTTIMGSIFEGCTSLSYISDFRSSKFVCVNSTIYDVGFS
ncbi:surface antigen BspA-like [Trichomonas vaginalis G3]|uniref:Surface antigen BspA-like n=1 Tax=Trichomonas vaginalis (strain ATCC PRA-98 / G3) TaxID=412133 RepID=A2FJK0_TRIV3|nr:regulation of response to stimulus [Trichomonas vaginalis G3]EAX94932.1 surface antigen BspA-like [Trichomonas vaginalis G3]KAI5529775.1 regulation of response to stimulus [Trichomonas vaginalis G3]|eukprot:XP_001307862.1 surface antigen BspA-like [Trichomonas vaginalis G3]